MKSLVMSLILVVSSVSHAIVYFQTSSLLPADLRAEIELKLNEKCPAAFALTGEVYEDSTTESFQSDMTWREYSYQSVFLASVKNNPNPVKINVLSSHYMTDFDYQDFRVFSVKSSGLCSDF